VIRAHLDRIFFLLEAIFLSIEWQKIQMVFFLNVFSQLVIGGPIKPGGKGSVFYFAV
jgi:hypothetical protein